MKNDGGYESDLNSQELPSDLPKEQGVPGDHGIPRRRRKIVIWLEPARMEKTWDDQRDKWINFPDDEVDDGKAVQYLFKVNEVRASSDPHRRR